MNEELKPHKILIVLLLTLLFWFLSSLLGSYLIQKTNNEILHFLIIFIPYIISFISLVLFSKFYLHSSIFKMLRGNNLNYKIMFLSGLLYLALIIIFSLFDIKTIKVFKMETAKRIVFILLSIPLFFVESLTEELFFRALPYKMFCDGENNKKVNKIVFVAFSSLLFLLPHLQNIEVKTDTIYAVLYYLLWGILSSIMGILLGGFDGVFMMHFVNNIYIAIGVNSRGSTIPLFSFFENTKSSLNIFELLKVIAIFTIITFLCYKIIKGKNNEKRN